MVLTLAIAAPFVAHTLLVKGGFGLYCKTKVNKDHSEQQKWRFRRAMTKASSSGYMCKDDLSALRMTCKDASGLLPFWQLGDSEAPDQSLVTKHVLPATKTVTSTARSWMSAVTEPLVKIGNAMVGASDEVAQDSRRDLQAEQDSRRLVVAFYQHHYPQKLEAGNINRIVITYSGMEAQLLNAWKQKYGLDVREEKWFQDLKSPDHMSSKHKAVDEFDKERRTRARLNSPQAAQPAGEQQSGPPFEATSATATCP